MSRIREDYEQTLWRKLVRFVNGEELDYHANKQSEKYESLEEESVQEATLVAKQFDVETEKEERKLRLEKERAKEADSLYKKYRNWPEEHGVKIFNRFYRAISIVVCISIIFVLLVTVSFLPEYGNPNNPSNNEVTERYIEKGLEETGATNIVAGMILDYRAFDTLGESHVLFIAPCCVLILLRLDKDKTGKPTDAKRAAEENDRLYEPKNDLILQGSATILVPIIILYGIYVILNGHLSPGGGFSGGAIIGAGLILYLNAFGFKKTERFFTYKTFAVISVVPLLFYAASKTYSFFTGANHLESGISTGTPGAILSGGLILPLNICVGMVVACTMYSFYALFRKGDL